MPFIGFKHSENLPWSRRQAGPGPGTLTCDIDIPPRLSQSNWIPLCDLSCDDNPKHICIWYQIQTTTTTGQTHSSFRKTKKKKKKLRFHRPQNNSFPFFRRRRNEFIRCACSSSSFSSYRRPQRIGEIGRHQFYSAHNNNNNWKKGSGTVQLLLFSLLLLVRKEKTKGKNGRALWVFNKTRTWIEKLEKCQGGQARPFCRALFYFRAPWWMTSSDGRVRQHTHTWESPAATHMAVSSSSFTALANRLLFLFHSLEKKKRFPGPTSVIPAPPSIPPLGCWSWWLINTFAYYSASISSLSSSCCCCCGCSFLFLLQLLFPYWLTSFPPWACQTAQASLFNHYRIKITSRKRKKKTVLLLLLLLLIQRVVVDWPKWMTVCPPPVLFHPKN